jgi:hypothetical protein
MITNTTTPPHLDTHALEKLRIGQRLIIVGILLNLATISFRFLPDDSALLIVSVVIGLTEIVISIIGLMRIGAGLGVHIAWRILLCILMFVPLINLVILLVLSSKVTKRLSDNGYKVGLLGAAKK